MGRASSPYSVGAVVAGKYRLIRPIGQGAMGAVWRSTNVLTGGEVALKLIASPEQVLRDRLLREARICSSISHKNVIQIHDMGVADNGDPFLVMELLSGENLREMLARRYRLRSDEAAAIGRDVARGLAAVHEKGVVHRDLKPANIFMHQQPGEDAPVVKVLDFGVSKICVEPNAPLTAAGCAVGSPHYMSPEQAMGDSTVDGRSDIWSLGVVLFELLTGGRPFSGDFVKIVTAVLTGEIPVVSRRVQGVDPEIERFVARCLSRAREERPWPAADVARQLDRFATSRGRRAPVSAPGLRDSKGAASQARTSSSGETATGTLGTRTTLGIGPPALPEQASPEAPVTRTIELPIGAPEAPVVESAAPKTPPRALLSNPDSARSTEGDVDEDAVTRLMHTRILEGWRAPGIGREASSPALSEQGARPSTAASIAAFSPKARASQRWRRLVKALPADPSARRAVVLWAPGVTVGVVAMALILVSAAKREPEPATSPIATGAGAAASVPVSTESTGSGAVSTERIGSGSEPVGGTPPSPVEAPSATADVRTPPDAGSAADAVSAPDGGSVRGAVSAPDGGSVRGAVSAPDAGTSERARRSACDCSKRLLNPALKPACCGSAPPAERRAKTGEKLRNLP